MKISMVVAMGNNRVIGKDGETPWNIPPDLKHFQCKTIHRPVIMGRITAEAILKYSEDHFGQARPLPKRTNIVLTRNTHRKNRFSNCGFVVFSDIIAALQYARDTLSAGEAVIIGGGQIYQEGLPYADTVHATCVEIDIPSGDAFFPEFEQGEWQLKENLPQNPYEGTHYSYKTFSRIRGKRTVPNIP